MKPGLPIGAKSSGVDSLDSVMTLDVFRNLFTWVPFELDHEIMQKFELFAQNMDATDIAFIFQTTPNRYQVRQILKLRYSTLMKRHNEKLSFEIILQDHKHDAQWLVLLSRRHWDPSDLAIIRETFLKEHPFDEQVWRNIRFCPQEEVAAYLEAIQELDNVPFAYLEHLRVEKNIQPSKMIMYVKENVAHPTLEE